MLTASASYLIPPQTRWKTAVRDFDAEHLLRKELGLSSLAATILVRRGFVTPEAADRFIRPNLDQLHDPRLLPDYEAAKNAILGARERKELIFVHGDYDVDGVTSAAILDRFLKSIKCEVHTHVPHRMREGYGINLSAVEAAKQAGAKLFLTCDCGVSAHEQVEAAKAAGMTVVVTDHHSIGASLPEATAVVNPHRSDSKYPFPELCGAGVVFKLCEGISDELGFESTNFYRAFLDLVALGTIADVVPLVDENRVLARFGLERLGDTKKVGLRALMRTANIVPEPGKSVSARQVGFQLGPRLNAAGRIDDAALSLRLLLERDESVADGIARELEEINLLRRTEQTRIVEEAIEIVNARGLDRQNVIVVGREGWHSGVIGIVASRLVETFRRPTFVAGKESGSSIWKSSARSIEGFHLADAIRKYPDLFLAGGGHAMAAGCSFEGDKFEAVSAALHEYGGTVLRPEDFIATVHADAEVDLAEVSMKAIEELQQLAPFGNMNPEPYFVARNVRFAQVTPLKNPTHARVLVRDSGGTVQTAMGFYMGERLAVAGAGTKADLLFEAQINEWNGAKAVQMVFRDFGIVDEGR